MSQAQAMINSLRAVMAVAIAEIDLSGLLLDANAGFLRLLPAGGYPAPGMPVAPNLISPSFDRLIELSSSGAETLYEGLMTLGDPTGQSHSLRGSVSRTERGLFLFLEYDVEELEHVTETALELSSELAQAHRELLSSHNQLKLKEAERAQSEQRLRRNESMLAEAQRLAKVGSWNWDILSDQILWSDEHYRIFGLNPHEIGMTFERFLSLVHPDDRETVRRNVELALQEGQPYECTMRAVHPDGTVRIVQSRAQVVRDDGKAIRMFGTVQDITEQRQLEEALSQEAIRRRILVEQSSDGIVVLDEDGKIFEANQRFGEMLGYTAEEVGQLHVWDWDVQWTREELLRIIRSLDESGSHFETRHRRKDGNLLDMEISSNGALCSGRKLVFCVCRDISRRKQAEKDIRNLNASLERRVAERTSELESMLANATVGLAFFDRELRCIRINSKLAGMSGLPVSDHLERKIGEINPRSAPFDESAILEVFQSGRPLVGGEIDFVSPASPTEKRSCVVSYYPVCDAGGAVISVGMTVTDITERKESEEGLAALNRALTAEVAMRTQVEQHMRRLADVVEASPDLVGMADSQGRIFYFNRSFSAALGRSPQREPLMIADCYPASALRIINEEGLPTAARTGVWRGETDFDTQEGQTIPVSQIIIGHHDSQGRLAFYSTIMRDMSERQRMEETLRHRSEALVAANAELARAARLKDEFLASMSHELRTPLNGILTMSESLQEQVYGTLNAGQKRAIRDIEECGRHLLALINDILDVAKIEAGKIELETHPVSVESLCQSSLRMVKDAAHKKKIGVSLAVDETIPVLIADERRVKQILVNLLSNAVKFTPEAGKIGLQVVGDRLNHQVRFTVWDTGIGVSAEEQPRLFKPFSQLDSGLARKYEGTGLGLALVKRLTEMHGGSVGVVSQPGQGSRFTVSLPWIETVTTSGRGERDVGPEAQAGLRSNTWESRGIPLILVVQDNSISARSLRDYLEFKGYRVEQASTADTGIERAGHLLPDLILVDVQPPELEGLEAVRRMRLLPGLSQVPIIVLRALATADDRERSPEGGATAYLSKPVMLDELRQAIKSLLSRPGKISNGSEVETP